MQKTTRKTQADAKKDSEKITKNNKEAATVEESISSLPEDEIE